jgi:pimeloyl-ACP methyl ester carboxylesterase
MKPLPAWFRFLMRTASVVPPLGASIAWRLFWYLGAPSAVRERERAFHESARVSELPNGVVAYEWGTGERVVLLVHGWRSRASRFAALGAALIERGYSVVSFDAPGNGDSPGSRTHAFDYAAAIRALAARHGRFEAIIAHSFGAIPTFIAARTVVPTRRIVTIAAVHDFDSLVATFAAAVGLGRASTRGLRRHITRWGTTRGIDVWREVVAELDPTQTKVPLLVVHDTEDREVPLEQAMQIAEAHTGAVETLVTEGLGHNRVLSEPSVVDRVTRFVATPIDRVQPTR